MYFKSRAIAICVAPIVRNWFIYYLIHITSTERCLIYLVSFLLKNGSIEPIQNKILKARYIFELFHHYSNKSMTTITNNLHSYICLEYFISYGADILNFSVIDYVGTIYYKIRVVVFHFNGWVQLYMSRTWMLNFYSGIITYLYAFYIDIILYFMKKTYWFPYTVAGRAIRPFSICGFLDRTDLCKDFSWLIHIIKLWM